MTTSLAIPPEGIGECVMTSHYDEAGKPAFTIDHADPVILVSAQLLDQVCEGCDPPGLKRRTHVRLSDPLPFGLAEFSDGTISGRRTDAYLGATLRIEGTDRTVVYLITGRHDEHTYIGRWPD
jgi:hypothetical protein